jgi:murein DD-endopeptidase MepM/ murein hydrolase activator NlpD
MMAASLSWPRWSIRAFILALSTAAFVACGGGDNSPTTSVKTVVDTITFGAPAFTVVPGGRFTATASLAGNQMSGTAFTWESNNSAVAQAGSGGLLIAVAPGTATVTAHRGTAIGSYIVHVADSLHLSDFQFPLPQSVSTSTVFDHDLPIGFTDANGYSLSYWGEKLQSTDLGHNGYDWPVPTGTPVTAAAAGVVVFAQLESPFACPLLANAIVAGNAVTIAHGMADGRTFETQYAHLSRIDVEYGQRVLAGQQIGLSGTTGCSTGPHLHFSVLRGGPGDPGLPIAIDPHGWRGLGTDPWAADSRGAVSELIWADSVAPIYRELKLSGVLASPTPVVMTLVHYMGVDDAHNPNNEYIDLAATPSHGDADLTGMVLRNGSGDRYSFPAGFHLAVGAAVRVYSGAGVNSATALYIGRTTPMWNNDLGCAELDLGSTELFQAQWGGGGSSCSNGGAVTVVAPPVPRDSPSPFAAELVRGRVPQTIRP